MTCRHGSPSDKCRICSLEKEVADQKEIIEHQGKGLLQERQKFESQKEEIEKWRKMYGQEREFSTKFQQERDEAVKKSVFWEDHCGNSELRIESLKAITELKNAEIEKLNMIHNDYRKSALARIDYEVNQKFLVQDENVILRDITELAVKGLEEIIEQYENAFDYGTAVHIANSTLSEIEKLNPIKEGEK